eukprot:Lithocolla_globosa_v1_NODE_663_length_3483_cov_6.183489.p4 type:complete len:109 gc:universal NODE_663_length_3483_cov_6.183489:1811-2137(+)
MGKIIFETTRKGQTFFKVASEGHRDDKTLPEGHHLVSRASIRDWRKQLTRPEQSLGKKMVADGIRAGLIQCRDRHNDSLRLAKVYQSLPKFAKVCLKVCQNLPKFANS